MRRWMRRLFVLLLLGAASGAAYRAVGQRRAHAASRLGPPGEWPPLERVPPPETPHPHELDRFVAVDGHAGEPSPPESSDPDQTGQTQQTLPQPAQTQPAWIEPVDGRCPDGYPVKANSTSRIFHVPGGRSYDRTVPNRCYQSPEAAERDGYRQAKV